MVNMSMSQILVSGVTFIKNALTLGYPIRESIESIEAICDEIIINIGFDNPELTKDDGTFEYLKNYFKHEKFVFIKSYWDPQKTKGGLILSEQTNIAISKARGKYIQYIQGDECIHEEDLAKIHDAVLELENHRSIDGLIFKYQHFYGNVDIIKHTRNVYRREVRLIRNGLSIKSWKDAQGFRHEDNTKIKARQIDATIMHYGWARKESIMEHKVKSFNKLYHGKDHQTADFNYQRVWGLRPFKKTHPIVMKEWIESNNNEIDIMKLPLQWSLANLNLAFSDLIEYLTDHRIGEYKNYIQVK